MTETNAVIGGEESGGFGFGMHIPERDGLASGLFLLDLWLTKGKQASEVLAELQALAGPSYYNRIDIRFAREGYDALKADTLAPARARGAGGAGRAAGGAPPGAGDRRRVQVLPRRRLVAADPLLRHGGAAAHLRRGALAGGRGGAAGGGPRDGRRRRGRLVARDR